MNQGTENTAPKLLRLPQVMDRTGLSRTSIYELIKAGQFPSPRRLLTRGICFREQEITDFINSLPLADAKELKA